MPSSAWSPLSSHLFSPQKKMHCQICRRFSEKFLGMLSVWSWFASSTFTSFYVFFLDIWDHLEFITKVEREERGHLPPSPVPWKSTKRTCFKFRDFKPQNVGKETPFFYHHFLTGFPEASMYQNPLSRVEPLWQKAVCASIRYIPLGRPH